MLTGTAAEAQVTELTIFVKTIPVHVINLLTPEFGV
jgi:hypothetical protein